MSVVSVAFVAFVATAVSEVSVVSEVCTAVVSAVCTVVVSAVVFATLIGGPKGCYIEGIGFQMGFLPDRLHRQSQSLSPISHTIVRIDL